MMTDEADAQHSVRKLAPANASKYMAHAATCDKDPCSANARNRPPRARTWTICRPSKSTPHNAARESTVDSKKPVNLIEQAHAELSH